MQTTKVPNLIAELAARPGAAWYNNIQNKIEGITTLKQVLKEQNLTLKVREVETKNKKYVYPKLVVVGKNSDTKDLIQKQLDVIFQTSNCDSSNQKKFAIAAEALETIAEGKTTPAMLDKAFKNLDQFSLKNSWFNSEIVRLRSALENPERDYNKIVKELIFAKDLETAKELLDFDIAKISIEENNVMETSVDFLINENSEYKVDTMLESNQVSAITNLLLQRQNIKNTNVRIIDVSANLFANPNAEIQSALIDVKEGKSVALQISDNGHWITTCLLPDGKGNVAVAGMDSMKSCTLSKEVTTKLQALGKKIGLNISNLHNLSVDGQQVGNCCGYATSVNAAAIMKTYAELPSKDFNLETFKKALLKNVFYRKNENGNLVLGNKEIPNGSVNEHVKIACGFLLGEISEQADKLLKNKYLTTLEKLANDPRTNELRLLAGQIISENKFGEASFLEKSLSFIRYVLLLGPVGEHFFPNLEKEAKSFARKIIKLQEQSSDWKQYHEQVKHSFAQPAAGCHLS